MKLTKDIFIIIHLIENIVSFISDGCCKGLNYNIFHQPNADEHSKFFYNESQILFNLSNMQTKHAGMENFSLIRASTNLKHFLSS